MRLSTDILKTIPFLLFYAYCGFISAALKYPADISYLVADFKYSQEHGLKICEVQQGALSAVAGDLYISGGDGTIAPKIAEFLDRCPMQKWATGTLYPPLKRAFAAKDWDIQPSINTLLKDATFLNCAVQYPTDPSSISSYGGIVYATFDIVRNFDTYRKAYPGILFMDAATLPYWSDKYKMNTLFDQNDELKQYKAEWKLYPKKYDPHLAERIQKEMPSTLYVIKPRREFLAAGVIITPNTDLDRVLQMILLPSSNLRNHADKKYAYWCINKDDTFLIEKYYPSDPLQFSSPLSATERLYDGTLRIAFLLELHEGKMSYHYLGGFWKLPAKALDEKGTLNEKRISLCEPPFYAPIDPALFNEINPQMERAMFLLYEMMLKDHS